MAEKWSKIAMESCAPWESTRTTAHFARKMVEKWRHIREETKRKMALLKRKTRLGQSMRLPDYLSGVRLCVSV